MSELLKSDKDFFDHQLHLVMEARSQSSPKVSPLNRAITYSLFTGGKRFRPLLCIAAGEAMGLNREQVFPVAAAVELIHSYSLVHDDLPCLDNDTERRGQPTTHIQFGESLALLAGDALLTEAFAFLADLPSSVIGSVVRSLVTNSGWMGMVQGQVLDIGEGAKVKTLDDLIHLHQLKTGGLIAFCLQGPALLADQSDVAFWELGRDIGLAFQIKDDLLDAEDNDEMSFVKFLGFHEAESYLEKLSHSISDRMEDLGLNTDKMNALIQFNLQRRQ
ncbi:MAG: polyprenyl synthetase family protein [Bdellovibrionales bacterium]|nr:polyprenyl synthetase family protein [Bdellovibrionales bacterium]